MNILQSLAKQNDLVNFGNVGLPFNPDIFINDQPMARQPIIDVLKGMQDSGLEFTLTGGYGGGHVSPEHTKYGTAIDLVPTGKTSYNDLVNALKKAGMATLVHDAGSGKHIHTYPGKSMIAKFDEKDVQDVISDITTPQINKGGKDIVLPNTGVKTAMSNQGYMGNLPMLGQQHMPDISTASALISKQQEMTGSQTPELDMLNAMGEPLFPTEEQQANMLSPQMQQLIASSGINMPPNLQQKANPFQNAQIPPNAEYYMPRPGQGLPMTDMQQQQQMAQLPPGVQQAMQGQMAGAAAKQKKGRDWMPLQLALMGIGQSILNSALKTSGNNMGTAQNYITQGDYNKKLLDLREKEYNYKVAQGGNRTKSSDSFMEIMDMMQDPNVWNSLPENLQELYLGFAKNKSKDIETLYGQKYAESQGAAMGDIEGKIGGEQTVEDVKRAEARGSAEGALEVKTRDEYLEVASKYKNLDETLDHLSDLADAATYTKVGVFTNEIKRQLGVNVGNAAEARVAYEAAVNNQVLPLMRATFGAQFTEREGRRLLATLGDINTSPSEKKAALREFKRQAKINLEDKKSKLEMINPNASTRSPQGNYTPDQIRDEMKRRGLI